MEETLTFSSLRRGGMWAAAMKKYSLMRSAWMANKSCAKCGSREKLEIDHIDPSTRTTPNSNYWSWPEDRRERELALCQVLCKRCHMEKSLVEQNRRKSPDQWTHGIRTTYDRKGCRCKACRECKSKHHLEYRLKNPEKVRRQAYESLRRVAERRKSAAPQDSEEEP